MSNKKLNIFICCCKDFGMGKIAEYFPESLKKEIDLKRIDVGFLTRSVKEYEIESNYIIYKGNIYFVNTAE